MKFSTQEEYGLRCLLAIARTGENGSATIPEISKSEGLSEANVAKLLMLLRKEGFVVSTRGQAGGYSLAKQPDGIFITEVLQTMGGKIYDEEFCERHSGIYDTCIHDSQCAIRSLWKKVQDAVDSALHDITLRDLLPAQDFSNKKNLISLELIQSQEK